MNDLIRHFKDEHYLCDEGDCKHMPVAAVFRTDIDLKGKQYLNALEIYAYLIPDCQHICVWSLEYK